ncbi:MAG: YraN family protein [Pseudomonadota bacterium]
MAVNLNTAQSGQLAEQQACEFLIRHGLQVLTRNYRCNFGEIDLIMQDHDNIVFVEVRVRNNRFYADAIESVDLLKQLKIIRTATHFLQHTGLLDKVNCRFDIIGISYPSINPAVEWITDAFSTDNF